MATINKTPMAAVMLLLGFIVANFGITDAQVGVCCGLLGNNLPPISEVVALYKSKNIKRMRIYDASHAVLNALKGSNIELILGVPNSELQRLTDASSAASWVQSNVVPFWPSVKIRYIAVGNEVSPIHQASLAQSLRPALVNVFNAVRSAGLHEKIKVSTAIDTTLIGKSYPPSEGAFRDDVRWFVDPIIGHLVWAKTPILANIYTYFSYVNNPADISLPYALFTSPSISVWDKGRGYQNLFDAMLDALYSSLEGAWGGDLDVVVSESGWPSAGGTGATLDNARTYYTNLIKHVKGGTPKRPNKPIETYLFALFNENQKSPELEKNFGVFYPNKQPKYNLNFGAQRNWDLLADQHNSTTLSLSSDM